nr:hypothetical protein [Tanacetum cinerariifolium]
ATLFQPDSDDFQLPLSLAITPPDAPQRPPSPRNLREPHNHCRCYAATPPQPTTNRCRHPSAHLHTTPLHLLHPPHHLVPTITTATPPPLYNHHHRVRVVLNHNDKGALVLFSA